jgi:hypothetical protein
MKILFLDDMKERARTFFNRVKTSDNTIQWALTAQRAIDLLDRDQEGYTYVFLDHDLDPGAYVGTPQEPTGMAVVDYIVQHSHAFKGTTFIVHSLNGPAASIMVQKLQDAELNASYIPFAWEKVEIKRV